MDKNVEVFLKYINNFDLSIKENKLKFRHTHRVAKNCEALAKALNLSSSEVKLAKLCGYLHDIGRFKQFKEYGTFVDKDSCDHGQLGYEVLTENNFIGNFVTDTYLQNIILNSVRYHNKLEMPNDMDKLSEIMLKIVRDADKIDIFELVIDKELYIDTQEEDISEYALETILNDKPIDKNMKKTQKDRILTWIGFVYDFNYIESLNIIKDNKYVDQIINIYKDSNEIANNKLEIIRNHVNEYIVKKIGGNNDKYKIQSFRSRRK